MCGRMTDLDLLVKIPDDDLPDVGGSEWYDDSFYLELECTVNTGNKYLPPAEQSPHPWYWWY